jgi:hypothetical protein
MLTNLRRTELRLIITDQQRSTGQNLPSDLYTRLSDGKKYDFISSTLMGMSSTHMLSKALNIIGDDVLGRTNERI